MRRRAEGALLAGCCAVYLVIATRAGTGVLRTQFDNRAYSQFFDLQAEALQRGELALPENSIGIEAFVVDGREQMYFGLFPALARLPVSALTDAWFGQLTVISSFLAWLVFVVSAWALTDRVVDTVGRISVPVVVIWKVGVALGTPMMMLAGPAWVFSEAIMWGVAATVLFQWRLYCELEEPSLRNELWLGAALVLAALNRPTLAVGCLLVTGVLVAVRVRRDRPSAARLGGWVTASGLVLVVPNLIRFDRPLGPPMELQLLSQIDEQRMRMLAYAGGDFVDVRYAPSTLLAYLRPDGVSLGFRFPFLDAPSDTPRVFLDAVFDITYRTPSIVATSTLLVVAAAVGAAAAIGSFRDYATTRRLVLAAIAGVPAAATLFVWGFIAPRYLADFVALLVPLGVLGTARLAAWGATADRRWWLLAGAAVLAAWSVAANAAMAVSSSYVTGPDGGALELVRLQGRGDFWTASGVERFAEPEDFAFDRSAPPAPGLIAVLGDCEAAYLSNGEPVDPWLTLAYGPADFRRGFAVSLPETLFDASVLLGSFTANEPNIADEPTAFELRLVTDPSGGVRLELSDEIGLVPYPLDVASGESFELTVTSDPVRRSMFFDLDGETVHYGHYLTRSLFDDGGQTVVFTNGGVDRGVVADTLPRPPRRC